MISCLRWSAVFQQACLCKAVLAWAVQAACFGSAALFWRRDATFGSGTLLLVRVRYCWFGYATFGSGTLLLVPVCYLWFGHTIFGVDTRLLVRAHYFWCRYETFESGGPVFLSGHASLCLGMIRLQQACQMWTVLSHSQFFRAIKIFSQRTASSITNLSLNVPACRYEASFPFR